LTEGNKNKTMDLTQFQINKILAKRKPKCVNNLIASDSVSIQLVSNSLAVVSEAVPISALKIITHHFALKYL